MRLIDADATFELLKSLGSRDYRREKGTICDAMKMVASEHYTPTVDAVEVVRCKDCKYCFPYTNNANYCSHYPYRECYVVVGENDYCSYGERKEDEKS